MHFCAVFPDANIRDADLERSPGPQHIGARDEFFSIRRRQQIHLVFHGENRGICWHQRVSRIATSAVCDGSRDSRMKIVVLLSQLEAERYADLRVAGLKLYKLRAQVFHQSLAHKTFANAAFVLRIGGGISRMIFHGEEYSNATTM